MKKIFISSILLLSVFLYADCTNIPVGTALAKSIVSKDISKAKTLLSNYKSDVTVYLKGCDNKDKFEETSIMIHTYEDKIADIEHDMNSVSHTIDCSKVPSSKTLENAFKMKDATKIENLYSHYKKSAKDYIAHCASHAEYETVYESSMFCDEMYAEWKGK